MSTNQDEERQRFEKLREDGAEKFEEARDRSIYRMGFMAAWQARASQESRPASGELRERASAHIDQAGLEYLSRIPEIVSLSKDRLVELLAAFAASERGQEPGYLPQQSLGDVPGTDAFHDCPQPGTQMHKRSTPESGKEKP